jgi:hypothetical protein
VDNLLRGDATARSNFYTKMFASAGITPNEQRERENLPLSTDPNADKLFVPANLVPIDAVGKNQKTLKPAANGANSLPDVIKKIAGRERENILAASRKYDEPELKKWIDDFYRDFPNYIVRQVEAAGKGRDFAAEYTARSIKELDGITPARAEGMLEGWVERKLLAI